MKGGKTVGCQKKGRAHLAVLLVVAVHDDTLPFLW